MQLAPIAPVTMNAHLVSTGTTRPDGTFQVRTTSVPFGAEPRVEGSDIVSTYYGDHVRIQARMLSVTPGERRAAQAVQDAVNAAALLALAVPADGIGKPAEGMTRLYLDRRSRMVEYRTDAPPAAVQPVLDAIAAWLRAR